MKLVVGKYKYIETKKREERVLEFEELGEIEAIHYSDCGVGEPELRIILKEVSE